MNGTDGEGGKPDDFTAKSDKLAEEAIDAGRKFVETDTGRKVAEVTDTAFQKAEDLGRRAFGQQGTDFAADAMAKAKDAIPNPLWRNMAIGAGAGAVVALPLPIIGPIFGAVVGAGIGYLRTVTKKN